MQAWTPIEICVTLLCVAVLVFAIAAGIAMLHESFRK